MEIKTAEMMILMKCRIGNDGVKATEMRAPRGSRTNAEEGEEEKEERQKEEVLPITSLIL